MDQTKDRSYRELHTYWQLYPIPEYVKQASVDTLAPLDSLPPTCYADPRNKEYRVDTKAASVLSYVYYLNHRNETPPKFRPDIEARFAKAAAYWGVEADLQAIQTKHAALHADLDGQLPDSSFALVWASDGHKERHYRLANPVEVKTAAEWFVTNRDAYGYADRQTMASKVLDKVAEFGVGLTEVEREVLEKQAGRGVYEPKACAGAIRQRVSLAKHNKLATPAVVQGMLKMAESVEYNPGLAMDPAATLQLAASLDQFDRLTGLTTKYAEGLARPEDIVCAIPYYQAGEFVKNACELITGAVYNKDQFSKLALSEVRELFGSQIADEVSSGIGVDPEKMAMIASTLPRGDAATLERLMAEASQYPVVKRAAAAEGFTREELTNLATVHRYVNSLPEPAAADFVTR